MRLSPVVFIGIVALGAIRSSAQQGAAAPITDLRFDYGRIADGVYTNGCLGIAFPIPAGWQVSTLPGASGEYAMHLPGGGLGLLIVDRHSDKVFGDRIALNALEAPSTLSVKDFVNQYVRQTVEADTQRRQILRDAFALPYGGKQFFRADSRQTFTNGHIQYEAFVYTRFRGYFIGETLMAGSPEALDEAANSLAAATFQEDRPEPGCFVGPDENSRTGIIGGIISSTPSPGSPPPTRIRVSQRVSEGLLTKKPEPEYPEDARQKHIEGDVVLRVVISMQGDVEDSTLVSGDPSLVPAALAAVKQWKYKPYLLNGQPVKMETEVTVAFRLPER